MPPDDLDGPWGKHLGELLVSDRVGHPGVLRRQVDFLLPLKGDELVQLPPVRHHPLDTLRPEGGAEVADVALRLRVDVPLGEAPKGEVHLMGSMW